MALINCPECSKEISDRAGACPHCGLPLPKFASSDVFTCRQCGKEFPFSMANCQHCGFCNAQQYQFKPTTELLVKKNQNYGSCSDCGARLDNDRGFCSKCGAIQINKSDKYISTSKPPTGAKSGWRFTNFLWIFGFVLLIGMCSTVQNNSSSKNNTTSVSSNMSKPDYESDLEERCKDWIYNRNRAYKLGREGDQKGAEQARRAMNQFYNDLKLRFSEKQISDEIAKLEAAGYKVGF